MDAQNRPSPRGPSAARLVLAFALVLLLVGALLATPPPRAHAGAFIERGVRVPSESGPGLLWRWGARHIGRPRGTDRPRFHAGWKLPGGGRRQRRPPRTARTHPDRGRTAHFEPARAVGTSQSASFSGRRSGRGERRDVPDRGHRAPPHLARANRWKSPGDRGGPRAGWIRRRWAPCRARAPQRPDGGRPDWRTARSSSPTPGTNPRADDRSKRRSDDGRRNGRNGVERRRRSGYAPRHRSSSRRCRPRRRWLPDRHRGREGARGGT